MENILDKKINRRKILKALSTSWEGDLGTIHKSQIDKVHIKERLDNRGRFVSEKVWITLLCNGFEKVWIPLLDREGNHIEWQSIKFKCGTEISAGRLAIIKPAFLFKDKFGVAPCSQKELNNSVKDNF
jgi:hypothetical protein